MKNKGKIMLLNDCQRGFIAGRKEGFEMAESYLKDISNDFYKQMKRGLLTHIASTSCTKDEE